MSLLPFSMLSPSIPIILIPAGNHTVEALEIVQKASREPFRISTRNQNELIAECDKLNIPCPMEFWAQFFPCYSVSDFSLLSERLNSEKSFYFFQYISVIVFIDYSTNKYIEEIQENYNKIINQSFPTGYFIYRAKEEIMNLFNDTTCISFETYSKQNVLNHIRQFAFPFIIKAIIQSSIFRSKGKLNDDLTFFPIKSSLICVATNLDEIIFFFEKVVSILYNFEQQITSSASFFEVCAVLERISPGFAKRIRITEFFVIGRAPWCVQDDQQENMNDIAKCLSVAGYIYNMKNQYDKMIDSGLRCIACGYTKYIGTVSALILHHSTFPMIKYRAIELVTLCCRLNCMRKAALFEYNFANSVSYDEKLSFLQNCMSIVYALSKTSKIQYEIVMPMLSELREVDPNLCLSTISQIFSDYGSKLPFSVQEILFQNLSLLNPIGISQKSNLNLRLISATIERPQCYIRPKTVSKESSIFIYNAFDSKAPTDFFSGLDQPIRFLIEIENMLQIPLPVSISAVSSDQFYDGYSCNDTLFVLQSLTPTVVSVVVRPHQIKEFTFSGVKCSLLGLYDIIKLPYLIKVHVIDSPATFTVNTSLPIDRPLEHYKGEIVNFSIIINNQGNKNICDIKTKSSKVDVNCVNESELPIEPMSSFDISCNFINNTFSERLSFKIICTSDSNSEYESVVELNQPLIVVDGLIPINIFPIKNPSFIDNFSSNKTILIGVEIENMSQEAFLYDAIFDMDQTIPNSEASSILSSVPFHGVVGKNKKTLHLCPINRIILEESDTCISASDPRVIKAARDAEMKYGMSGSLTDRQKIIKMVNLSVFLAKHLTFNWKSTDGHKGVLPIEMSLPDQSYVSELNTVYPDVSIYYRVENEDINDADINTEEIVEIVIDFHEFMINKCNLDIKKYISPSSGVIWDGRLMKTSEEGVAEFIYKLCFTKPGFYEMPINYWGKDGTVGSKIATLNVVKD